MYVFHIRIVKW